jgi:hypothetical protein
MLMAEVGKSWTITKSVQRSKGINTQGESACQALKRIGRQGLYKVCQRKMDGSAGTLQSMHQRGCIGMLQRLYKVYNKDQVIQDLKATDYWRN